MRFLNRDTAYVLTTGAANLLMGYCWFKSGGSSGSDSSRPIVYSLSQQSWGNQLKVSTTETLTSKKKTF